MSYLDKDRARLNFLSCDFVSSNSGYFHSTVEYCDGFRRVTAHCPTIRQAVDLVAEEVGGKDWVTRYTTEEWAVSAEDEHNTTFDGFGDDGPIAGLVYTAERFPGKNGAVGQHTAWTDTTTYPEDANGQ